MSTTKKLKPTADGKAPLPQKGEKLTTLEMLVKQGAELTSEKKAIEERLKLIKEQIDPYFKGEKTNEKIATKHGIVERKITNKWSVKESCLSKLKEIFGEMYSTFVSEKKSYSPSAAYRKLIDDADYQHSKTLRDSAEISQSISISFGGAE